MSDAATADPREKFERFVRAGGDLSSVPEDVWNTAGGPALREKLTRFDAAGGDRTTFSLPAQAPTPAPMFREGQSAPGASAWWNEGAVKPLTQTPAPGSYESPDAYRRRITTESPLAASVMEAAAQVGGTIAHGVADPIMQADQEGTASGWAKGVVRSGIGAATAPFAPAATANRLAREQLATKNVGPYESKGTPLNPIARAATSIGNAVTLEPIFRAWAEKTPDFDKMAAESRRLGMPLAEFLSNVAAVAKDVAPIAVGAAGAKVAKIAPFVGEALQKKIALERSAPTQVAIDPAAIEFSGGRAPPASRQLPAPAEAPPPAAAPAPAVAPPVASLRARAPGSPPPQPWMPPVVQAPQTAPQALASLRQPPPPEVPPVRSPLPAPRPAADPVPAAAPVQAPAPEAPAGPPRAMAEPGAPPARVPQELTTQRRPIVKETAPDAPDPVTPEPTPQVLAAPKPVTPPAEAPARAAPARDVAPAEPVPAEVTPAAPAVQAEPSLVARMREKLRAGDEEGARTEFRATGQRKTTGTEAEKVAAKAEIDAAEKWARENGAVPTGRQLAGMIGVDPVMRALKGQETPKASLRAQKPRKGPTVGVGLGGLGKFKNPLRNWIEAVEKPIAAHTEAVIEGARQEFPVAHEKIRKLHEWALRSSEDAVSPEFGATLRAGKRFQTELQMSADEAVRDLLRVEKSLPPGLSDQIARSLNSEVSDLSGLGPEQRAVVERARGVLQKIRRMEADLGLRSEETQTEYPQGRLSRLRKRPPGLLARAGEENPLESVFRRTGGVKTKGYKAARDMHRIFLRMSPEEAREFIPAGAPLRYIGQQGGVTMLKFTEGPEGFMARNAVQDNVAAKLKLQRSLRGGAATTWIRAGDVPKAKKYAKLEAGVQRMDDIVMSSDDPIPADAAKKTFVQSPAARLKATTDKSGRNIANATTLKNLSTLTDEKGPIAKPVPAGVRRGTESANAPDGFEYLEGDQFGDLSGKYVRTEAAKHIRGAVGKEAMSNWEGVSRAAMETFKVAVLLPSPRTWFRQVPSNMEFENDAGISNWNPEWAKHKAAGLAAMKKGHPFHDLLASERFFDPSTITLEELGAIESEFAKEGNPGYRWTKAILTGGMSEAFPRQHKAVVAWLGRRYGFADAWTKATIYTYARNHLKMDHGAAAEYVREWTPSPDAVSDVVRNWSNNIYGDAWARFRAESLRINLNAARKKPVRFAMNFFQKNLIRAALLATGASVMSDDEEEALENEQGGGALAVGRDDEGRILGLNYAFLSTMQDFFDTPSEVGRKGEHVAQRALKLTGAGNNPLWGTIGKQLSGYDEYGRPINPEGTLGGRMKSIAKDVMGSWVPGLLTRHRHKIVSAFNDKPYSPNQPKQTRMQAILDVFFGMKLTPLDANVAFQKIQREGAMALDRIETVERRKFLRDEGIDVKRMMDLANAIKAEAEERKRPLKSIKDTQKNATLRAVSK